MPPWRGGGHLGNWVVSGEWSTAWAKRHISWLELQVVWLTLKHFLPQSGGAALDVLSDNATTVAYINKEGRTLSPSLCRLALKVSTWCREHPVASHFSWSKNVSVQGEAPPPHRMVHAQGDGGANIRTLADHSCGSICVREEQQGAVFFSAGPSPTSSGLNALTQNWEHLYGYTFPPFSLIPRVLRKQVAAVSPGPIDGAVLAQSTVVTSPDEHAGGHPTGDPALGQPPEELCHGNVLPCAAYLYGLPPRILCWPRVFSRGCWHGSLSSARIDLPGLWFTYSPLPTVVCGEKCGSRSGPSNSGGGIPQWLTDSPA